MIVVAKSVQSEERTTNTALLRVAVDTDILVSGFLSDRGPSREIVDRWLAGEFTLLATEQMLLECERILEHPSLRAELGLANAPQNGLMAMLRDQAERVEMDRVATPRVLRNPFNQGVLLSAIAGQADYLVTEEEDLLALREFEGVTIASPERFVQSLVEQPVLPGLL